MPMKTPEAIIDFLLTCMDCTEGKTNWEEVATKTGWYKSGKFSRQAFVNLRQKYGGKEIGKDADADTDEAPKVKKSTTSKKRAAAATKGTGGISDKKMKMDVFDDDSDDKDD